MTMSKVESGPVICVWNHFMVISMAMQVHQVVRFVLLLLIMVTDIYFYFLYTIDQTVCVFVFLVF